MGKQQLSVNLVRRLSLTACLFSLVFLTSCIKRDVNQGYSFGDITDLDTKIANIKPHKTSEIEILKEFGSPTTISNFGPDTFFYISRKVQYGIISNSKLIDQRVLAIAFDKNHIVQSVEQYSMKDVKNIKESDDKVEFKGNELGLIEQFSRNIGKFNKKKGN